MMLVLLHIIYIAIGLFWITIFCLRESILAIAIDDSVKFRRLMQVSTANFSTHPTMNTPAHFATNSTFYGQYQVWGLIPAILGTTLFATIACGYLDQFQSGWIETWYMQIIFISGGIGLLTSSALAITTEKFLPIKILFTYLLITCVVIQMNIIHFLWLW